MPVITGTAGSETLNGTTDSDKIDGLGGNDTIHGDYGNDVIDGGSGDDVIYGDYGDDTITDGAGSDTIYGGSGRDTIIASVGAGNDIYDGGSDLGSTFPIRDYVSYELALAGVRVDLSLVSNQAQSLGANDAAGIGVDQLINIEAVTGSNYGDVLIGDAGANVLNGRDGNDSLSGGAGNDALIGGDGDDVIDGQDGTDLANYYTADQAVNVSLEIEGPQDTGQGIDTLISIENLAGSNFDDILTGNWLNNSLLGNYGNDQLNGLGGNDYLYGDVGNDILDGGEGADIMEGDFGDDTYIVDNLYDEIVEYGSFYDSDSFWGIDTVMSSVNWTLGEYLENLTLTGSADLSGTGNGLANTLTGNDGNNLLSGLGGDDRLFGGLGNDTLTGGVGLDKMYGGMGDDIYVVTDATDYAYENVGEGVDLVQSSVSLTLRANVENLTLTGVANVFGKGNELDNAITGNNGANKLYGLDGDDVLVGGGGSDRLEGGSGADQLNGGTGDDFYYIDDGLDTVSELAGQGNDRVYASLSHVLDANVELMFLTGTAGIDGTGNGLNNFIYGNDGDNVLSGMGGSDRLYGYGGNDHLDGGLGELDRMYGGVGDDVYSAHDATDHAYENVGEGHDTVYADVSYTLRVNVEDLVLTGSADTDARGNDGDNGLSGNGGDNKLYGYGGNDTVDGGGGNDWLEGGSGQDLFTGGAGADVFVLRDGDFAGLGEATADRILDYNHAEGDHLRLNIVDANTVLGGDQAFTFIGTAAFGNVAGQLRFEQLAGNTYVMGDTNGDGTADFWIRLDGLHTLSSGDFIL